MAVGYNPRIVTDGLVLCLDAGNTKSFNAGISTTAWNNLSGSGIGTFYNGPTYNSANSGSILFDGTNDYMSFSGFTCNRQYYSVEWWTRPTGVSNFDQMILMNSTGSTTYPGNYYAGFSAFSWASAAPSGVKSMVVATTAASYITIGPNAFTDSVWQNFAVTFNNGSVAVYKNGVGIATGTNTVWATDFTFLQIGAGPGFAQSTQFDGRCSSLRVYSNKVLTQAEVSQNFNALRGRFGI